MEQYRGLERVSPVKNVDNKSATGWLRSPVVAAAVVNITQTHS